MYIRRKVYSSYVDENGEERLFSTNEVISEEAYLGQREFNSKAAKALNNKYLKQVASKTGIPVYEAAGFKTVEIDPRKWKNEARLKNEIYTTSRINTGGISEKGELFNREITERPSFCSAANRDLRGMRRVKKRFYPEEYDHGVNKPIDEIKGRLRRNRRYLR